MNFLAWCVSWFFYGTGHITSLTFHHIPFLTNILYPIYNNLMHWSMVISDKYDLGVWKSRQVRLDEAVDAFRELMEEDDEITIPFIIEMLLKDHDFVYVAMVAKQLQQQLWDQVTLGIEVGNIASVKSLNSIKASEAAVGNRTPGVIFMNPRNGFDPVIPGLPNQEFMNEDDIMSLIGAGEATKSDIVGFMRNRNPDFCTDIPREPNNHPSPCNEIALSESQPCTLQEPPFVFEIGKAYRHSDGGEMFIVGRVETTIWGNCLIAEEAEGRLKPVGSDRADAVNWHEIPMSEWMKNFD